MRVMRDGCRSFGRRCFQVASSYEPDIPQSTNARVGRVGRRASQISKVVNIDQIFGEEVCILLAQAVSVISKTKWK